MPGSLTDAAGSLARRVLKEQPERLAHSEAVARQAWALADTVPPSAMDTLVAAAWLHDIGYASALRHTGFHPLDGALYLRRDGWPEDVCTLVAHHSGSRFVAKVCGFEDQLRTFGFIENPESDVLTVADNTTGPNGTMMTVQERLREKSLRHGPNSPGALANPERDDYIRAAATRVEQRLARLAAADRGSVD